MIPIWLEYIALLIVPYILFAIAFILDKKEVENWVIRKYMHSIGLIIAGLYAVSLPTLEQILILVAILLFTVFLFSLPPIYLLQNLTRMGNRQGESQKILLINSITTGLGFVFLVILLFDYKWIYLGAVLTVAIGDGLGEFIGRPFGKHQYKILSTKSIEGSLGVFFGSLFGGIISALAFTPFTLEVFLVILFACVVVTIIEAVSVMFVDNIAMQFVYAGILWFLLVR